MLGALETSWESWRKEHAFGVLCGVDPRGERFVVLPSADMAPDLRRRMSWRGRSEAELRQHLMQVGRLDGEIEEAIQIARQWATTTTSIIDG